MTPRSQRGIRPRPALKKKPFKIEIPARRTGSPSQIHPDGFPHYPPGAAAGEPGADGETNPAAAPGLFSAAAGREEKSDTRSISVHVGLLLTDQTCSTGFLFWWTWTRSVGGSVTRRPVADGPEAAGGEPRARRQHQQRDPSCLTPPPQRRHGGGAEAFLPALRVHTEPALKPIWDKTPTRPVTFQLGRRLRHVCPNSRESLDGALKSAPAQSAAGELKRPEERQIPNNLRGEDEGRTDTEHLWGPAAIHF